MKAGQPRKEKSLSLGRAAEGRLTLPVGARWKGRGKGRPSASAA